MSVKLNIIPPLIDLERLVVACSTFGFFVSELTAFLTNGAVVLIAGFKNLVQAVCVPLVFFLKFRFYQSSLEHILSW